MKLTMMDGIKAGFFMTLGEALAISIILGIEKVYFTNCEKEDSIND